METHTDIKTGLTLKEVKRRRSQYGPNALQDKNKNTAVRALFARFKNPLVIILLFAASLSLFFGDKSSFIIITTIVLLSIGLDFVNTFRSQKAADELRAKVRVGVTVVRAGTSHVIPAVQLVPGDIVVLAAGKVVPADGVARESKDLFANEAALTGESFPQAKGEGDELYMGSGIMSGKGLMEVTAIGRDTKFAHIAAALQSSRKLTEFQREIRDFSFLIVKVTFFLVLFVFFMNILFQRGILDSLLFSLALAVGLTPELLPLIITLNLTKGSLRMAKEGVIVKQLSAVQNFGSMDVLCTDKTGTLTEDKIALVRYVDGANETSDEVLRQGYLASVFSTSFENPLDTAVEAHQGIDSSVYQKIDEIPFDFERKREAVVVHHVHNKQRMLIVKGAPEELFKISTSYRETTTSMTPELLKQIEGTYEALSKDGFRVLAIASKQIGPEKRYEQGDEAALSFQGFLAFLDPAKATVTQALEAMREMGIMTKIITGDNALVTQKIAHEINLNVEGVLTGPEIKGLSERELAIAVEKTTIFARVNPEQKMQIIEALQSNGHVVGFMGDGINDAPSLRAADVGISVNNATDVAKDAADFILLRKSLAELANGIVEGRKTFANTLKYLRMSLSSNFGNMFSMAGASLFLPFLPMLAPQILLNNLLYDASQFAIPLDNVDDAEVKRPHTLSIKVLKRFMWSYGLLSSLFDFATFGVLLLIFHVGEQSFQAGWFIESMMTQVFVVYIIRTKRLPFIESIPSLALILSTLAAVLGAFVVILIPWFRDIFHFGGLAPIQIGALACVVFVYLVSAQLIKRKFYGNTVIDRKLRTRES